MKTLKITLLAGAAALGLGGAAHAQTAYSLDEDGTTLVAIDPVTGASTTLDLTGADGGPASVDALTFRPETGQLYGYDGSSGELFTIDLTTGVTSVEFQSDSLPGGFVSFEINNNLDAFRFINSEGANVVYFPENTANGPDNAGRLIAEDVPGEADNIAPLTFNLGFDDATGQPVIIGNGYTNQLPAALAQAQDDPLIQYVLDANTDSIAILNNNAGTIDAVTDDLGNVIGAAGFDFDVAGGFDVFSTADSDIGYALLTVDGVQSLYSIDLSTFVFTQLFETSVDFGELRSLAVFDVAPIPLPAGVLLFGTGMAGLAAARRRKATRG